MKGCTCGAVWNRDALQTAGLYIYIVVNGDDSGVIDPLNAWTASSILMDITFYRSSAAWPAEMAGGENFILRRAWAVDRSCRS